MVMFRRYNVYGYLHAYTKLIGTEYKAQTKMVRVISFVNTIIP